MSVAKRMIEEELELTAVEADQRDEQLTPASPSFSQLVAIEPELGGLYREIKGIRAQGRDFCANDIWYRVYKPRLSQLTGWEASKASIRTMQAYDVAYSTLYEALPPCRRCGCARLSDFGL
jgi:hypothetical protein